MCCDIYKEGRFQEAPLPRPPLSTCIALLISHSKALFKSLHIWHLHVFFFFSFLFFSFFSSSFLTNHLLANLSSSPSLFFLSNLLVANLFLFLFLFGQNHPVEMSRVWVRQHYSRTRASQIWSLQVPNKVNNLMWRACQNALPTKVSLVRRTIIDDPLCDRRHEEHETPLHDLWLCKEVDVV